MLCASASEAWPERGGKIQRDQERRDEARQQAAAEELTLERSNNAAGFRGVYPANGPGFQAMIGDGSGGQTRLGTFKTAEEAALAFARAREQKVERLAAELDARPKDVQLVMTALSGRDLSLDVPVYGDEGGVTYRDRIESTGDSPEAATLDRLDAAQRRNILSEAVDGLNDRERSIIRERYLADEPRTLREVGEGMGLSRERVRQLESQALRKLKTRVRARYRYTRAA